MKLPILLGALLLSATPAVADNFLYVRCKTEVTATTLRSNQVVNSEQGDMIFYFKTDLKNSRIMNSTRGEWDKLEIKNGVAFEDKVNVLDGLNYHTKTSMEIQPLGKIVVNVAVSKIAHSNDDISQMLKGSGDCQEVDASAFEKAMKQ